MNFFSNIFKRRDTLLKEKSLKLKSLFDILMPQIKNSNIDLYAIRQLILLIKNELSQESSYEEKKTFIIVIRKYFKYIFTDISNKLNDNTEKDLSDYYWLFNSILFFLLLLLNLNCPDTRTFIDVFFEKDSNFISIFFKCIHLSFLFEDQHEISKLIMVFYSSECLSLFSDYGLIEVYSIFKEKLIKVSSTSISYRKISNVEYKTLIKYLLVLDCDFKSFLEDSLICSYQDKPVLSYLLCQSILRVMFSKEKEEYLNVIEDENTVLYNDTHSTTTNFSLKLDNFYVDPNLFEYFEINFLENIVYKAIDFYYKHYDNKIQVLFRKEKSYDEIIKNILLSYGGQVMMEVYDFIKFKFGEDFQKNDVFSLVDTIVQSLLTSLPTVIRVILWMISNKVQETYQTTSKDPIFVVLIFNFLFNPKVQMANGISPSTEKIRNVSLLIHRISFNQRYKETERFSYINPYIEELNKKLVLTVECLLEKVNVLDKKKKHLAICEEIYNKTLPFPSCMFYIDCDFILRVLDDFNLVHLRRMTTKTLNSGDSSESFIVKFNKKKMKDIALLYTDNEESFVEDDYNRDV